MPDPIRLVLAAALALAAPLACAEDEPGTLWLCHLDMAAVRLACVADADAALPVPPSPTTSVNGTSFPLDPARRWFVELWTPPSDMEFVAQLARATICYRSPGCSVQLVAPRPGRSIASLR